MKYLKTVLCLLFLLAVVSCKKAETVPAEVTNDTTVVAPIVPVVTPEAPAPELPAVEKGVKESEKDE